jgi:hypothetical protein
LSKTWRRHKSERGNARGRTFGSPADWQRSLNRMCRDKVAFPKAVRAEASARKIVEVGGPPMRAYSCPSCGKWHLTTQPERS